MSEVAKLANRDNVVSYVHDSVVELCSIDMFFAMASRQAGRRKTTIQFDKIGDLLSTHSNGCSSGCFGSATEHRLGRPPASALLRPADQPREGRGARAPPLRRRGKPGGRGPRRLAGRAARARLLLVRAGAARLLRGLQAGDGVVEEAGGRQRVAPELERRHVLAKHPRGVEHQPGVAGDPEDLRGEGGGRRGLWVDDRCVGRGRGVVVVVVVCVVGCV